MRAQTAADPFLAKSIVAKHGIRNDIYIEYDVNPIHAVTMAPFLDFICSLLSKEEKRRERERERERERKKKKNKNRRSSKDIFGPRLGQRDSAIGLQAGHRGLRQGQLWYPVLDRKEVEPQKDLDLCLRKREREEGGLVQPTREKGIEIRETRLSEKKNESVKSAKMKMSAYKLLKMCDGRLFKLQPPSPCMLKRRRRREFRSP